jgi:hypothetical protein
MLLHIDYLAIIDNNGKNIYKIEWIDNVSKLCESFIFNPPYEPLSLERFFFADILNYLPIIQLEKYIPTEEEIDKENNILKDKNIAYDNSMILRFMTAAKYLNENKISVQQIDLQIEGKIKYCYIPKREASSKILNNNGKEIYTIF